MSRVYHAIRGQAMIKLYVLFTMIEIFDRLFSSIGQDVLDSLYYTSKYHPRRVMRMFLDFAVAIIYVVLHSLLLFAQVVTLNVAVNSSNTSLLTLLIFNNFTELKSSVFKKFEEQNLFQISCSDIVERFKLLTIIGLILLQSSTGDVAWGTVGCFDTATFFPLVFVAHVLHYVGHGLDGGDADRLDQACVHHQVQPDPAHDVLQVYHDSLPRPHGLEE